MDAGERRQEIINILNKSKDPVKGTELAEKLQVSRQVIVQDIAILRAKGENIFATPQGYLMPRIYEKDRLIKTIVCNHKNNEELEDELRTIVDLGGKVIDVIVEHPLYGEIKSQLQIGSRHDLMLFMDNLKTTKAEPLSSLTDGVHLHTIEVNSEEIFHKIKEALSKKKYLIKE
ncbi:transcription repressor NadR [Tissierella pigra]|uniref:Transcription repressor NadR n=1 Tax=Tissierella pigra TaxID=2607614 RepID=A0A6N7XZJ9_9FIRM|nr:transcription repressor NadR [Tissierella pigra]MBU5428324.1 transcription repressor NadR [Tissierella pigra]MSU01648.1 transcription repressor NadR [Tissierella pigra]